MTVAEYNALKKQLDDATARLEALQKEHETLSEMIISLATILAKGVPPADPIQTDINDTVEGSGTNQSVFSAGWTKFTKTGLFNNDGRYSNTLNATVTTTFWGTKADLITELWENHGIVGITLDGGAEELVDLYYAGTDKLQEVVWNTGTLTEGLHTFVVRVTGQKNASASAAYVTFDKVRVYSRSAAPTPPPPADINAYYVTPTGTGVGTQADPMSPAAADAAASSGKKIILRGGTYRRTFTPSSNGVTYQAYPGETVIVSGLEQAGDTGWTVYSGQIYKKTVTLPVAGQFNLNITSNTTLAANQVFKDGNMVIQARWPKANTVENLFEKANLRWRNQTSSWTTGSINDSGIPAISGGWAGGKILVTGWFAAQTGNISGHSGTTLSYNGLIDNNTNYQQYYYLTGRLGALTQANEFHYESAGSLLYVWQPGGGSPTGIEYKARNWGFDLSGRSGITITGVQLVGCDINGNTSTASCIIDNNKFKYMNHAFLENFPAQDGQDALAYTLYGNARQTGLKLAGTGNIVRNNEFKYAACNGVLIGHQGQVTNNKFDYINYHGNYSAPVMFGAGAQSVKISNNSFTNMGRAAVDFGWVSYDTHLNNELGYNDISRFGSLSTDGGGIYAARYQSLIGTRVHHNWIHNSLMEHSPTFTVNAGINAGLYYDHATGSGTVNDHNVLWDNRQCDLHISTNWTGGPDVARGKAFFYNNTLCTRVYDNYVHGYFSYLNICQAYYDVERNNIYRARNINVQGSNWADTTNNMAPFDMKNCLHRSVDPLFSGGSVFNPTSVASPQTYFQLTSGSPARNAGISIAGINDDDTGGYDIGAYAYGQPGFVAGFTAVPYNPS